MASPGSFAAGGVLTAAEMNALPGGVMGVDVRTTSASLTTSFTTTHSITFTAVSGRRYVALFNGLFEGNSTAGAIYRADINVAGNRTFAARVECPNTGDVNTVSGTAVFTASGSTTVDVACNLTTGTGQLTAAGSITSPLIVFDIGEA